MFEKDLWSEVFQSIQKNKLRAVLSGLTIAFSILLFTLLFGMANGLQNTFESFFMENASNVIYINSGKTSKPYKGNQTGKKITFKSKDYDFIKKKYPDKTEYISARVHKNFTVTYQGNRNNYNTIAVHADHQYIENTKVSYGRYFTISDIEKKQKFLLIGKLVADDLFKGKNPIGKYVNLQGIAFKIIGVFEEEGDDREERNIYMPISTAQSIFSNDDHINDIRLTYDPKMNYDQALSFSNKLTNALKERFFVAPKDQSAIRVFNIAEAKKNTDKMMFVLGIIILLIGFGTLVAGVVGISNIMVYIVSERSKELGIRKVLGASPRSITGMILFESVLITAIAGYIGMLIGIGTLTLLGNRLQDYFITNPNVETNLVITATVILIISGSIAGYIPAKKAAKIKPITALNKN